MDIKNVLDYINRTNKDMTKEQLVYELNNPIYSAKSLILIMENSISKNFPA